MRFRPNSPRGCEPSSTRSEADIPRRERAFQRRVFGGRSGALALRASPEGPAVYGRAAIEDGVGLCGGSSTTMSDAKPCREAPTEIVRPTRGNLDNASVTRWMGSPTSGHRGGRDGIGGYVHGRGAAAPGRPGVADLVAERVRAVIGAAGRVGDGLVRADGRRAVGRLLDYRERVSIKCAGRIAVVGEHIDYHREPCRVGGGRRRPRRRCRWSGGRPGC